LFNHKTYQVQDVYIRPVWILKNTFGIQVVKTKVFPLFTSKDISILS